MVMASNTEVLAADAIYLGRAGDSMHEAIEFVGGQLVERGVVGEAYIQGMKDRETSVSTYLGNGIALPHGTFETKDEVTGTALVVAQYPEGVDWGGGNTAHLVIGLAAVGEDHVHVLSHLAEILQDEETCQQLWVTDDVQFLYESLQGSGNDEEESDETTREVTILNPAGLHARPAALIVERAAQFDGDVNIYKANKSANAKSIMSVLALGAVTGNTVTLTADGDGADEVLDDLETIMTSTEEHA